MNAIQRYVPTEPGYYYYQDDPYDVPSIALVWENGPGHLVVHTHGYQGSFYADDEIFRWIGPVQDWPGDVREFHRVMFPHLIGKTPAVPSNQIVKLRTRLIDEEYREMMSGIESGDIVEIIDGALDLVYVVLGMVGSYGVNPAPIWKAIQDSNMAKKDGPINAMGKKEKPPGWTPPDVHGELCKQGWEG